MKTKAFVTLVIAMSLLALGANAWAGGNMPAALQGIISIPANARIVGAKDSPPYLEVVTSDSQKRFYEFFKADLVAKGWKIAGDYPNMNKTYQIQFKKDGKTLTIAIGSLNNGDSIARIMLM